MGGVFGPFFEIEPKSHPLDSNSGDIIKYIMDNIAQDVRIRLKSRLDTGIVMEGVTGIQGLTVVNTGTGLEIHAERKEDDPYASSVHDLFSTSDKPPHVDNGKLVFRQIREHDLRKKNIDAVRYSFEESMYLNFKRHFEDGIRKVVSEKPEYTK